MLDFTEQIKRAYVLVLKITCSPTKYISAFYRLLAILYWWKEVPVSFDEFVIGHLLLIKLKEV